MAGEFMNGIGGAGSAAGSADISSASHEGRSAAAAPSPEDVQHFRSAMDGRKDELSRQTDRKGAQASGSDSPEDLFSLEKRSQSEKLRGGQEVDRSAASAKEGLPNGAEFLASLFSNAGAPQGFAAAQGAEAGAPQAALGEGLSQNQLESIVSRILVNTPESG